MRCVVTLHSCEGSTVEAVHVREVYGVFADKPLAKDFADAFDEELGRLGRSSNYDGSDDILT